MITVQGSQQSWASDAPLLLPLPHSLFFSLFSPFFDFFCFNPHSWEHWQCIEMLQWGWDAPKDVIVGLWPLLWALGDTMVPKPLVSRGWICLEHPHLHCAFGSVLG